MSNIFHSIYSLAACVAAAVSQSKKAVSAAAAAIVGIGLFLAPMESAQTNHGQSTVPTVLSVDIDSVTGGYSLEWMNAYLWPNGHCGVINSQSVFPVVLYGGGYLQVNLYPFVGRTSDGRPVCSTSKWIEFWVWLGTYEYGPYAYAYDSDGNFYYVDLYLDGYWISSGPPY